MKLVIIDGPTSTGKSTLARKLAADLQLPAFLRDDYKEREYDRLGKPPTLRQLTRIDKDSRRELYKAIAAAVKQDTPLIVESNFTYSEGRKIRRLIGPDTVVAEVFCSASGFKVLRRYVSRNRRGERHKGHRDRLWYPIVAMEAFGPGKARYRPLKLSTNLLKVDANDFAAIDYDAIRRFVQNIKH